MRNRELFLRFCITGGIGFAVDFILLHAMLAVGAGPLAARFVSVSLALACTWWLNRRFTFRTEKRFSWKEILGYLSVNGIGAAINYVVYSLCVLWLGFTPAFGLVIGSAAALFFNFLGNKRFVFRPERPQS